MSVNEDSTKVRKNSIIIKRVTKVSNGEHKGAWKVAFADFAFAMMALFLVLWLIGTTSESERRQMAHAIKSHNIIETDGSDGILDAARGDSILDTPLKAGDPPAKATKEEQNDALSRLATHYDSQSQLSQLSLDLSKIIRSMNVSDSVAIDVVEQGVRVRFQDQATKPLFASGSRELSGYFVKILRELAPAFVKISNKIIITGHSDATPLNNAFYSNWELSTERAISARHILIQSGMPSERVIQLAGYADTMPLTDKDPLDPANRRIEVMILTERGEKELKTMFKTAPVPAGEPPSRHPEIP
ncbi:flagellar motor protein MotB [Enterobacter ludwigii]